MGKTQSPGNNPFPGDYILVMDETPITTPSSEIPGRKINFFASVHKSILSPEFYRSVQSYSPWTVIKFVMQMCLMTALISGAAFTYYALDDQRGLPSIVSQVFPGMSLKNGVLDPGRATPFIPEKAYVGKMLNMLLCMPGAFDALPDSFLVVDTSKNAMEKSTAEIMFSDRYFAIKTKSTTSLKMSYSKIIRSLDTIEFSRQGIHKLLRKNAVNVFINFFIQSGIITTGTICVSIIFLTLAAYVFRVDKRERPGNYFKKACFAVSPIFVGCNLVAVSGTHIANTWFFLLMISVFVMFRGVRATAPRV
jgi:hypothetical protein